MTCANIFYAMKFCLNMIIIYSSNLFKNHFIHNQLISMTQIFQHMHIHRCWNSLCLLSVTLHGHKKYKDKRSGNVLYLHRHHLLYFYMKIINSKIMQRKVIILVYSTSRSIHLVWCFEVSSWSLKCWLKFIFKAIFF